jgi:hypothetical protein
MGCDECRRLLSEGLDLCVRARKLDAQERTNMQVEISGDKEWWTEENLKRRAAVHNKFSPETPVLTKCATIPLWIQDHYDKDLYKWEQAARNHLMIGCPWTPETTPPINPAKE